MGNLRKILSEKENILNLVQATEKNLSDTSVKMDENHLKRVLEAREKELKACDHYLQQILMLMGFCAHLTAGNIIMFY